MFSLDKKIWQWGAILLLAFVWGASFILIKKGLEAFSYMQVGALRVLLCAFVLLPVAIKNLKIVNKKNVGWLIISGLTGNFIPALLFSFSQTHLSSSLAGTLNSLTPFFVLIVGIVAFKNRPTILQYIGVLIGFVGVSLLITGGNFHSFGNLNVHALFIALATFLYGINANLVKFKFQELSGAQTTSLVFFFMAPPALITLLLTDFSAPFAGMMWLPSLSAIFILALFGSGLSLFLYYNLIHRCGAIFASSTTYIIPLFALMWGVFDGEKINITHLCSLAIILVGVYLSSFRRLPVICRKKADYS